MNPNRSKGVQMGSNGSKVGQMGPNRSKEVKKNGLNGSKQVHLVQTYPNRSLQVLNGLKRSKMV